MRLIRLRDLLCALLRITDSDKMIEAPFLDPGMFANNRPTDVGVTPRKSQITCGVENALLGVYICFTGPISVDRLV